MPGTVPDLEVSVVIPVLNETPNIHPLVARLRGALEPVCRSYEIIFVAGGSTDKTEEAVLTERTSDPRIKLLWLSRNFGHQEAITAGLDFASGQAIITMDGDLQHPPELLPELLEQWRLGHQVVTTRRVATATEGLLKRLSSRWFYRLINRMSQLDLPAGSADFRLLDRTAAESLRSLPERSRFVRGMVRWIGYEQTNVEYVADGREAGASKYGLRKLVRFGLLATLSFSAAPLYFVALLGFVIASLSFAYGIYAILAKLLADVPPVGWASLLAALAFLGGVQLVSLGVVGAYVARIYEESKQRPIYLVRKTYGLPAGVFKTAASFEATMTEQTDHS